MIWVCVHAVFRNVLINPTDTSSVKKNGRWLSWLFFSFWNVSFLVLFFYSKSPSLVDVVGTLAKFRLLGRENLLVLGEEERKYFFIFFMKVIRLTGSWLRLWRQDKESYYNRNDYYNNDDNGYGEINASGDEDVSSINDNEGDDSGNIDDKESKVNHYENDADGAHDEDNIWISITITIMLSVSSNITTTTKTNCNNRSNKSTDDDS